MTEAEGGNPNHLEMDQRVDVSVLQLLWGPLGQSLLILKATSHRKCFNGGQTLGVPSEYLGVSGFDQPV